MNLSKESGIARSVCYYRNKTTNKKEREELVLSDIKILPKETQNSGSKVMSKFFKSLGIIHNHKKLSRIRKTNWIRSKIRKRKYPKDYYKTLEENREDIPQNILNRDFNAFKPMAKIVADMTYIRVMEGWLYLNSILDLYNGEIVSHSFSMNINEKLAIDSLNKLSAKYCLEGTLFHTDQGSPYLGKKYRDLLKDLGIVQSMSRRGNCWDNACMENFFGTLKCETIYLEKENKLLPAAKMIKKINDYIDYYNNVRIKKKLGWLSPVKFRESIS